MAPCLSGDVFDYIFPCPCLAMWAVRQERIPDVHDGEDARLERDLLASQSQRIACPIPFLMVEIRNAQSWLQIRDGYEHFIGILRMLLNDCPLLHCQFTRLEE